MVLGGGTSIKSPGLVSTPEQLLIRLNSEDTSMLPCELREVLPNGRVTVIFKGYLISGGVTYMAGSGGNADVAVTAVGLAACLMTTPGSAYVEAALGHVLDTVKFNSQEVGIEAAIRTGNNYLKSQPSALSEVYEKTAYMPLVKRIATLVRCARVAISTERLSDFLKQLANGDAYSTMDANVLRVFGGRTDIRYNILPNGCPQAYSNELMDTLLSAISSSSVLQGVQSCVTSPDFGLEMVPRWSCDAPADFKIDIKPITAWRPRKIIGLTAANILSLQTQRDVLAAVNTPDVVLTEFPDPAVVSGEATTNNYNGIGVRGIAAKNPKVNAMLASWSVGGYLPDNLSAIGKVKMLAMPKWCALSPAGKATTLAELDKRQMLANRIAQLMLQYYYRATDQVELQLPAAYRFGYWDVPFENSLGERVVVSLYNNATKGNRGLALYGCLHSIEYNYVSSTGGESSAEYAITLNRVMFIPPGGASYAWQLGTLDMDNPIYTS